MSGITTKIKPYLLLHISILIYTLSGVASKFASRENFLSIRFLLFLGLEVFILGIYAILWQQVLKKIKLSVAYANKGATLLWSLIWGILIFRESFSRFNIIGIILVIAGIILVNFGDLDSEEKSRKDA